MQNIKISIYIDDISKKGGTERVAAFLANYLSNNGLKIQIITLSKFNDENFFAINPGVDVKRLNKNTFIELISQIRRDKSDTFISISMGRLSFKIALVHKVFKIKSRLILSEHVGFDNHNFFVRILKLISYRCADDLVLLTDYDFNRLKRMIDINVVKIGNPSSFQVSGSEIINDKRKIVLAVGRLTYQKNFHALMKIWANIKKKNDWILRIVGDGEDLDSLSRLVEELKLQSEVEIVSPTQNIENEFTQARIIAMTSRFEGLPLVLIEAKSFGVASIAYNCKTGPAEIIQDGNDGFLIPLGDESAFIKKLQNLIMDEENLIIMQHNAIKNSSKFSMQSVGQEWINLLNK